jgi:hypothetical protein
MPEIIKETVSSDKITFFSEIDMDNKGKINTTFPSWYFDKVVEDKEESIRKMEYALKNNHVPPDRIYQYRENLTKEKEHLDKILEAKPNIKKHQDRIASAVGKNDKEFGTLGAKISDSMFSRDQMMKGLADAHTEADRMVKPCIHLAPEEVSIAKAANVRLTQGNKVSRNDAEVIWKLGRKAIGESTDTEILRR